MTSSQRTFFCLTIGLSFSVLCVLLPVSAHSQEVVTPSGDQLADGKKVSSGPVATSEMREWRDSKGKSKIKAKLLSYKNGKVELEKSTGRVITLPDYMLSRSDQLFLKDLTNPGSDASSDNPFAGGRIESSADSAMSASDNADGDPSVVTPQYLLNRKVLIGSGWNYRANPPHAVERKEHVIPFETIHPKQSARSIELIGEQFSETRQHLVVGRATRRPQKAELIFVDLDRGTAQPPIPVPAETTSVLAISRTGSEIAVLKRDGRERQIDFWKTGSHVKYLAGWRIPEAETDVGFAPTKARFIGEGKFVTVGRRLILWDIKTAKPEYSIRLDRTPYHAFRSSGTELAVSSGGFVRLVDVVNGTLLGQFSPPHPASHMVFSDDGRFLAGRDRATSSIWIWDLEANELAQQLSVARNSGSILWIGNRYLLIDGSLIDLELRAIVWQYDIDGKLVNSMDGRTWLISKSKITQVTLPHIDLDTPTASHDPDSLLLFKPGGAVALDLKLPFPEPELQGIRDKITASLSAMNVSVDPSAPVKIIARVATGKPDKLLLSHSFINDRRLYSFTPSSGSIRLVKNGKTLWVSSRRWVPGYRIKPEQGETVQQAIDRTCKPDASFYSDIVLPKHLAALPSGEPLGSSRITESQPGQ